VLEHQLGAMVIISKTPGEHTLSQILSLIIGGSILGVVGGIIAGVIGGSVDWLISRYIFNLDYYVYERFFDDICYGDIILIGIPVGLTTGFITGILSAIFRQSSPKPLVWTLLTGVGAVTGLLLSGFSTDGLFPYHFVFKVGFVSLIIGWSARKFTMIELQGSDPNKSRQVLTIVCSGCILFLVLIVIYRYFTFWLYLMNIPS
jgi:hypothetical protein